MIRMNTSNPTVKSRSMLPVTTATLLLSLLSLLIHHHPSGCHAFLTTPVSTSVPRNQHHHHKAGFLLFAKKKGANKSASSKKGFGKVEQNVDETTSSLSKKSTTATPTSTSTDFYLQSVEEVKPNNPLTASSEMEEKTPEERAAELLRNKYGLKTLAEQQQTAKQIEQQKLEMKKVREWKQKVEQGDESMDIFKMLPAPVIIAIDRFLKGGLAISTLLFILGGFAILLEAWSKTTSQDLPEDVQNLIINVVEPNFTPGLVVLLTFSISLGIFAALQLGSEGATYREKD